MWKLLMYKVNEIFYSLQGEGFHTGKAAVFVRLSGCNLRCPFCDTDFSSFTLMTAAQIAERVFAYSTDADTLIVLTGGEPSLQADAALTEALHRDTDKRSPSRPTALIRCLTGSIG